MEASYIVTEKYPVYGIKKAGYCWANGSIDLTKEEYKFIIKAEEDYNKAQLIIAEKITLKRKEGKKNKEE